MGLVKWVGAVTWSVNIMDTSITLISAIWYPPDNHMLINVLPKWTGFVLKNITDYALFITTTLLRFLYTVFVIKISNLIIPKAFSLKIGPNSRLIHSYYIWTVNSSS